MHQARPQGHGPATWAKPDFDAKKEKLTPQEHRFLELFFFSGEGLTREEAVRRAGLQAKSKSGLLLSIIGTKLTTKSA